MRSTRYLVTVVVLLFSVRPVVSQRPALRVSGERIAGGLMVGTVPAGTRVEVNGRRTRVSARGTFLLGTGRNGGTLEIRRNESGRSTVDQIDARPREYRTERIRGAPMALVRLDGALGRQQRRADQRLDALRRRDTEAPAFERGFQIPLEGPRTGFYGSRRLFDDVPGPIHWGLDIARPSGTRVEAPAGGKVVLVDAFPAQGRMLVIDHGHGLMSSLLHLRETGVRPNERVRRGQAVGTVGATGRATGPHLDWRVHLLGVPIDPETVLESLPP
ncbi:MAG: M23 family metallopeptidase [Myxococcota bacterium]